MLSTKRARWPALAEADTDVPHCELGTPPAEVPNDPARPAPEPGTPVQVDEPYARSHGAST
ncbi:hypothetical protein GCM10009753_59510 [Streptantibioticus ferralitis]